MFIIEMVKEWNGGKIWRINKERSLGRSENVGGSKIGRVGGGWRRWRKDKKVGKGENHKSEERKTLEDYKTANKIMRLRNLGPAGCYKWVVVIGCGTGTNKNIFITKMGKKTTEGAI